MRIRYWRGRYFGESTSLVIAGILIGIFGSLGVLGFSQGVATVARWITMGHVRPHRLVLWGGSLPPELTKQQLANALASTQVDLVHGKHDELVPASILRNNEACLQRSGIAVRCHEFPGGHRLDPVILARCMAGLGD